MAISVRTRFEVFKRDDFTCKYCGRKSPDVVLEVDHIVPVIGGGQDDLVNLLTSCWECNRGKAGKSLTQILTGEDPHDKAIEILERKRQLEEYNRVLAEENERMETETWELVRRWKYEQGYRAKDDLNTIAGPDYRWLKSALKWCPKEKIWEFMEAALLRGVTKNFKYVGACARNWRYEHMAAEDMKKLPSEE